jgi:hypothetical protein
MPGGCNFFIGNSALIESQEPRLPKGTAVFQPRHRIAPREDSDIAKQHGGGVAASQCG